MSCNNPSIVIAPYLEPVVRGRRVAVLGNACTSVGQSLLDRGARLVHVYDPDTSRVSQALAQQQPSRSLMIAPLPDGDVAVRDGAFDAVIVPELMMFDPVDSVVAKARKLVANHGHALFVTRNPDGLDQRDVDPAHPRLSYYELYDVVALQFPEVRMLGQAPFSGYVIADFAPESDPDVVVDTSLVDAKSLEPRWFMALGTYQPRRLEPYTIIQVPTQVLDVTKVAEPRVLDEKQSAIDKTAADVVPALEQPQFDDRVAALEASLHERDEQLRQAQARAGDNHVRAERLEGKLRDLEEELFHQRDRAFRLSNDLEEERKQRTKAELELGIARGRSEHPPKRETAANEIEKLREALSISETKLADAHKQRELDKKRLADADRTLQALRDELEDLRALNAQSEKQIIDMSQQLKVRDKRIVELDTRVVELQQATPSASIQLAFDQAKQDNERLKATLQQALSRADEQATLREERDKAFRRIERIRDEQQQVVARLTQQRDVANGALHKQESQMMELRTQLKALREQAERHDEEALKQAQHERDEALKALKQLRQEQERDISRLEDTLQQRGRQIQSLRQDIVHHERLGKELVQQVQTLRDNSKSNEAVQQSEHHLSELLEQAAVRERELQQARWRIGELEQKLQDSATQEPSTDVAALEQALFAAINEKEALRQELDLLKSQNPSTTPSA